MHHSYPINIAIACGGTGGHLFPGLAVAEQLRERECAVTLIISNKEVDQQAARSISGMEIITLPAVGLSRGAILPFMRGFLKSYRKTKEIFRSNPPAAVLAMGLLPMRWWASHDTLLVSKHAPRDDMPPRIEPPVSKPRGKRAAKRGEAGYFPGPA